MSSNPSDNPVSGEPEPSAPRRRQTWLVLIVVLLAIPACTGIAAVFLVLTGIIAEPETVIEQIIRTLFGA